MTTTWKKLTNNAHSTLALGIDNDDTAITLDDASDFPASASFWVSINNGNLDSQEIVLVTGTPSGDTFPTITRAQQGTSATSWPAGSYVELLLTKEDIEDIQDAVTALEQEVSSDIDGVSQESLVAYWPLEATAPSDYAGNGYNGTDVGGTNVVVPSGRFGSAISFVDGTGYITFGTGISSTYGNVDVTMACWVKNNGQSGNIGIMGWYKASAAKETTVLMMNNGLARGWLRYNDGSDHEVILAGTTVINDNEWHHLALVRDYGSTVKLYVDGVQEDSDTDLAYSTAAANVFTIGALTGGANAFIGYIDEAAVFSKNLSADEVWSLAHQRHALPASYRLGFLYVPKGMVVNEGGLDADTRFEGDTDANLLFLDASTDRAMFGGNSPARKLEVLHASSPQLRLTKVAGSEYWDLQAGGTGGDSLFLIGASTSSNNLFIGSNDTVRGALLLYGHATGSDLGGVVRLYLAADHDTTINNFDISANQDDLQIGPSTDLDSLKYDGGLGTWNFTGTGGLVITNTLTVNGNVSFGDASTDTVTLTARLLIRQVTDAGPMTATNGTEGELVYNLSNDKAYVCTATGTPATWGALN